jgi:hypothetical protein
MSIKEKFEKVKTQERELFIACLIVLVAFLSFGLGRLSKIEGCQEPVRIEGASLSE